MARLRTISAPDGHALSAAAFSGRRHRVKGACRRRWRDRVRPATKPVLIVDTRYDHGTFDSNAVRVHSLLPKSALLTVDGVRHAGLPYSSL